MLDNEIIKEIVAIIRAGLTAAGTPYSTATLSQKNQPTQQGAPSAPAVFLYKIGDHRYGSVGRQDTYNEYDAEFIHTETQAYETTFQVSTLVSQNPANTTAMTASDLANRVAAIMQSSSTLETLRSKGLGIYRVTDVRNPYFTDDRDRNEASPSFDFTVTHKQVIISTTHVVETAAFNFHRV